MQVHIRDAKGGKDRLVPLPKRTLHALQVLLRHASLNTTARYTQLTQLKQKDAAIAINQLADKLALDWSLK